MKKPIVVNYPMIGTNVAMLVKTIHEATLQGYEPVYSQCHNHFGSVTVTMKHNGEGEVGEQSVGEGVGTGNSETINPTGGEEDRTGETTGNGSGTTGNSTGDGSGDGNTEGDTGQSTESGSGTGEETPEVKAPRKKTRTQTK